MTQISAWFVVLMGIGTVFVGLICIVLICSLLGAILKKSNKTEPKQKETKMDPEKRQELLAVMTAAIAATAKTDPACIRFISAKKVK